MKRNPNHQPNFKIPGYKNLGWLNNWKRKPREQNKICGYENQPEYENCRKLGHRTREINNSLFLYRGTENVVICDECKIYYFYDCSD